MSLPEFNDNPLEIEYGKVNLACEDEKTAAILAVHPSGSNYRQFSQLPSYVPTGYASMLVGLNMFGYGKSDTWGSGYRPPTLEDMVRMVDGVVAAEGSAQSWHLVGHSMGGGLLLATAGLRTQLRPYLISLTVFEPNLFLLLAAGNEEEKQGAKVGAEFFNTMLAAAAEKNWELWGETFHKFWFPGDWSSIDQNVRAKLVNTTLPSTIHEIQAFQWGMEQGPMYAKTLLRNLSLIRGRKRFVMSAEPGIGSKDVSLLLGSLLEREAGFEVVVAPVGGHMGPLTHPDQVLPLLLH